MVNALAKDQTGGRRKQMINNLKVGHISFGRVSVLVDDCKTKIVITALNGKAIKMDYMDFSELCFWAPVREDEILVDWGE